MKIILVGYGAMGKAVARLAEEKGYEITGVVVPEGDKSPYHTVHAFSDLPAGDVIIDFSHPDFTLEMLNTESIDLPIIIATTGQKESIIQAAKEKAKNQAVFFSPNMSFGVHVMTKIVELATQLLEDYDIELLEKHHNQKIDAPSGTLNLLLDTIKSVDSREDAKAVYNRHDRHEPRAREEIGISSIRAGTIVGEHDVFFAGTDEEITISHRAQSKDIFANGALQVAPKLIHKEKGFFTFDNL
ncbi:MAG: 4-hydroxy-tetrahydrodipicolinate reductase [Atopostipes suicloacalis]|nr:4-hydroxy-tetrahydrodipicolinate reductase [Atopostipes suicloacalis]MDN6730591.1 4-hydroxy-tetrahydrodipicolinate reductase [Atopostipes suicloacalis]